MVHALLHAARNLDKQYPDRKLVALGHSPSWLVVTAAMIRYDEGRSRNAAFIPFSGHHLSLKARGADITYQENSFAKLSTAHCRNYFNALARKSILPATIYQKAGAQDKKPVLIDYGYSARGMMSFIDAYLTTSEASPPPKDEAISLPFDVHLYKLGYESTDQDVYLCSGCEQKSQPLRMSWHIDGSDDAYVLEQNAGFNGVVLPHENESLGFIEAQTARFMPYVSLKAIYNHQSGYFETPDNVFHKAPTSPRDMKSVKSAIREALNTPIEDQERLAQAGLKTLKAKRRVTSRNRWIPAIMPNLC